MPVYLRQSTASQEIPLGYFVDSTDGNTEETALTIANTDIKIWKTGATTLANKNSGGATHISNGLYYCTLDAIDTDTIGPMVIHVHVSGALYVRVECCVLDEAVYDVLFGTTAPATATNITAGTITTATNVTTVNGLAANVITAASIAADAITAAKIADGAIDANTFAAGAITASAIAADAIGASELASDAIAEIADAVWDEDATAHQTGGTFGQAIGDPGADTNTIFKAVVTDATGATVGVDVAAVLADTGTDGVVVASINANAITATAIAADAITAAKIADGAIDAATFAAGAITASAIAADAIGASELASDAVSEIADAVWDEATSGHTTAGTFGQQSYIVRANTAQAGGATTITLDASASATNDIYNYCLIVITGGTGAGQARYITGYDGTTKVATVASWQTNPDNTSVFVILPGGQIPGATAPTAGEVADAVWDEAQSGHTTAGTFGRYLDAQVANVETDTQDIQSRLPAALVGGRMDSNVGSISADATAADNLEAILDGTGGTFTVTTNAIAWNAAWDTEVQSEVDDALVAQNLDHLVKIAVDTDFATTVHLNSVIGHLADNGTSATFDRTTDSLEAARDNIGTAGAGLTAADDAVIAAIGALNNITAASVWAVGTRTLTAGTNIDGSTFTAIPWNASWDAEVQSEVQDALTANFLDLFATGTYTVQASPSPTTTVFRVNTSFATGTLNDQLFKFTSGTLVSQAKPIVSSVQIGGSVMELTFDEAFTAAPTAGDTGIAICTHIHPTSQIADAVLDEAMSGHTTAGTLGKYVADVLDDTGTSGVVVASGSKSGYTISGTTTTFDALQTALNSAHGSGSWATATGFSTHSAADVWSSVTRTLTALDEDTTTIDLDAAIRAALGMAAANLDTQLDTLPTANENADALLDRSNGIETSVTLRQAVRACASILAGIISGAGTGTEVFKGLGQASGGTTRVTVTVDSNGNRSALTLNL